MYTEISRVHLEVTSKCNARCPQCMRNIKGSSHVATGLEETDISITDIKNIFSDPALSKIKRILINGNYGDFVMHESPIELVREIRNLHPLAEIKIHTNGGALKESFWKELASFNPVIEFGIDGLEDTHHLYRRNTNFKTIIKNASAFINAGGRAEWMMTVFKHNQHQILDCQEMANTLGFAKFTKRIGTRGQTPVLDNNLNLEYILEPADILTGVSIDLKPISFFEKKAANFSAMYQRGTEILSDQRYIENSKQRWLEENSERLDYQIECKASKAKEIYISAQGFVYPCCWLGAQKTYGKIFQFYEFEELLKSKNMSFDDIDLKKYPLSSIIDKGYFGSIEESFTGNKLKRCVETCTMASKFDIMHRSKSRN